MTLNICFADSITMANKRDSGLFELVIDLDLLENRSGKFAVMIAGKLFLPAVDNNTIKITTHLEEPRRSFIGFYSDEVIRENPDKSLNEIAAELEDSYTFLAEAGQCHIISGKNIASSNISNLTSAQAEFIHLLQLKDGFYESIEAKYKQLVDEHDKDITEPSRDSIIRSTVMDFARTEYPVYYNDKILNFIQDHPNAPASAIELEEYSHDENLDVETLIVLYNNLSERVKNLPVGWRINNFITARVFARGMLHKEALDFTQADIQGNDLTLSHYKGKYVLMTFWASWCGACHAHFPALKNIYNKHKSENFEIIGLSLDTDRENWIKTIQDNNLNWLHVSDLRGWKNVVAQQYKISGVPANFLIDNMGKVIGYNLKEEELDTILSGRN